MTKYHTTITIIFVTNLKARLERAFSLINTQKEVHYEGKLTTRSYGDI